MPTYTYTCAKGHETDRAFYGGAPRVKTTRCSRCRRRARYNVTATFRHSNVGIIDNCREEYADGMGRGFRSRRQFLETVIRPSQDSAQPLNEYERVRQRPQDFHERGQETLRRMHEPLPGVSLGRESMTPAQLRWRAADDSRGAVRRG